MKRREIPLFEIGWDESDLDALKAIVRTGRHWAKGESVEKFERLLARYLGVEHCVVFNSGTSALHSLMLAHGIARDDEIIVPSFTFVTTATAPLFVQARPVFAEIEEHTFGLDPRSVREKIGPRTRAILAMHYGGTPCRIEELRKLARGHGLLLIEDAAGAFGATVGGRKVGTFGDSAIFSFCQNKIVTTGEGGCAVTRSRAVCERLKRIRSHGESPRRPEAGYLDLGYNFRMSSLSAALGLSQLKKVRRTLASRREVASRLVAGLSDTEGVRVPESNLARGNSFQLFPILVDRKKRDPLARHLAQRGISSKPYFSPVHLSPYFKRRLGFRRGELPVTESLAARVLCLPIYPGMTRAQTDYVTRTTRAFFSR